MMSWDHSVDFLVVGSGGGGMTAAMTAHDAGMGTLIVEKGPHYGGSTAMSGGTIWAPCNHLMKQAGIDDTREDAFNYLKTITKGSVPDDRIRAYVDSSPEMVRYLEDRSHVRFRIVPGYSDYYPGVSGSKSDGGRTIEPLPFYARRLGKMWYELRSMPSQWRVFRRILLTTYEFHLMFDTSVKGRLHGLRFVLPYFVNPMRCFARREDTRLTLGSALAARLRMSLADRGVPLWLNTAAKRLIVDDGRVTGIEAVKEGKTLAIQARRGVVFAAGGFERNRAMREKYQRSPVSDEWTLGNFGNTGDAIRMGLELGAALDLMDEAWWMSTTLVPGSDLPYMVLVERSLGGSIMVNSRGRRFTNEAAPYIDVVKAQYENHSEKCSAIPAFLIVDENYHRKYPLGPIMPWSSPRKYIENGFAEAGASIRELAVKCGIDPDGLEDEVASYNRHAENGEDPRFGKGKTRIERYYSDPSTKPNPCVGPLKRPPFYAMKVWPGDLGTKGGLVTDTSARVLREDGSVIERLYATGNCSASVMGTTYAGAGSTIGPSMTFGYIAALHAKGL
jgi:3-oxosteroid 1-dehydrogenase